MSDNYDTRVTLLQRVRDQHDDKSWNEFIETYKRYIYAVIRRTGVAAHDADDLLQKVFITVWEKMPEFTYDSSKRFRSWLCMITRNKVMNFISSKQAYIKKMDKLQQEEATSYLSTIDLPDIENIAEQEWETFITNMAMKNIAEQFSGKALEVFNLTLKGKEIDEIAVIMDLKENSVYRLKNRVKAALIKEVANLRKELE